MCVCVCVCTHCTVESTVLQSQKISKTSFWTTTLYCGAFRCSPVRSERPLTVWPRSYFECVRTAEIPPVDLHLLSIKECSPSHAIIREPLKSIREIITPDPSYYLFVLAFNKILQFSWITEKLFFFQTFLDLKIDLNLIEWPFSYISEVQILKQTEFIKLGILKSP